MQNPALPRTHVDENGQPLSDIDPLRCSQCSKVIFSTARCVGVKKWLYCDEVCADKHAIRRLRNLA